jgi:hypothetical protein
MAKVAFTAVCPEAFVGARIEHAAEPDNPTDILFETSGKKTAELAVGTYDLAYRAQGTPGTPFSLKVTDGATMTPVDRTLPASGKAAGVRTLVVHGLLFPIALLTMFAPAARAQEARGSAEDRAQAERSLTTLPNVGDVLGPGYFLMLEASSDSKTGSATIAVENQPGSFSVAFSLEGPLSESTKNAQPLTLNGLANNGTASVALHWFHWPGAPDVQAMRDICQRALHKNDCDDDELTDANDRRTFLRLSHASGSPTVVNASVSAGRKTFKYVDKASLASESEGHNAIEASAGFGHYARATGYLAATYRFQRQFEAGDSEQLCSLNAAATLLECRSAVVGPPSRTTRQVGSAEWRWFFPGGRLAVNPSVARDFRGDVSSVDFPVYFLSLAAGGLAGGARASWRSDEKSVAVSVFVGAALRLTQ